MVISQLVIDQIKNILISNREKLIKYNFIPLFDSTIIMEQECFSVLVNYKLFTPEQIISNEPVYNDYLREKINELFDESSVKFIVDGRLEDVNVVQ
jgi:hypothetical protein